MAIRLFRKWADQRLRLVVMGRIVGPFGVAGWLKVNCISCRSSICSMITS